MDKRDNLEVALFKRPDNSHYIKVKVKSKVRFGLISSLEIDTKAANGQRDLRNRVIIAAGALAEYQAEKYNDKHDPAEFAKIAGEAFDRLIAAVEEKLTLAKPHLLDAAALH